MKISKLTDEDYPKAYALLRKAFPNTTYETQLVEKLHANGKIVKEWACIHINTIIAYIAFTNAYNGSNVCGLHLMPLAVKPEFQKQGVGSELLRFALRKPEIKGKTIFVFAKPLFFQKFGFEPCSMPACPFHKKNNKLLSMNNNIQSPFTVGYEPEFEKSNIGLPDK